MPPIREHDELDDDMPPLVDPPMEFTFDVAPFASTPPDSPQDASSSHRISHAKKRDASYIPRPPNAFILFRSSFIRSQQVTGKVEGNHSNLSKIIGMYWKTLPREEREAWEAKAVIAQAEHRKRYPDWRFRPGANALAKLKFKDGGGPTRRGRAQAKDPPDRDTGRGADDDSRGRADDDEDQPRVKAKGKERKPKTKKETEKERRAAQRYAKITDLLVQGKKGAELETAIAEWEKNDGRPLKDRKHHRDAPQKDYPLATSSSSTPAAALSLSRSPSPDATHFTVASGGLPLTHMFKRSLSAPAPAPAPALQQIHPLRQITLPIDTRTSYPGPITRESTYTEPVRRDVNNTSTNTNTYQPPVRRDTISLPLPVTPYTPVPMHSLSWQQEEDRRRMEVAREHGYWWTGSAEEDDDDMYETYPAPTREPGAGEAYQMGVEGMGYDDNAAAAAFDQAYLDNFPSTGLEPHGQGQGGWTILPGRQGLITILPDPFMRKNRNSGSSTPSSNTPPPPPSAHPHAHEHAHVLPIRASSPPPPLTPLSPDGFDYYPLYTPPLSGSGSGGVDVDVDVDASGSVQQTQTQTPVQVQVQVQVPASTFSTLAGWDGVSMEMALAKSSSLSSSRDVELGVGQDMRVRASPWVEHPGGRWGMQSVGLQGGFAQGQVQAQRHRRGEWSRDGDEDGDGDGDGDEDRDGGSASASGSGVSDGDEEGEREGEGDSDGASAGASVSRGRKHFGVGTVHTRHRYQYSSLSPTDEGAEMRVGGVGMGVGLGLARGVDRGLGMLYDDDDDDDPSL